LNPRKAQSGQVPVVYDPRVSGGLLRHFSGAISGAAIARGTSFLKDQMDKPVFAEGITVIDDPHRKRGLRSRPFDGEGIATSKREFVQAGVLQSWVLDCRSARQLGLETTGHAARGTSGPPSPSSSNLYVAAGDVTPDAEMFRHVTPANDLEFRFGVDAPTLRVEGMTVAGQ
jgi:PmbA protein